MGGRAWADKDIEWLKKSWGNVSMDCITKRLKRTKGAVLIQAKRLGLPRAWDVNGHVYFSDFYKVMGGKKKYCSRKLVKAMPLRADVVRNSGGSYKYVDMEEWWAWAGKNRRMVNLCGLEKYALGPEPEWTDRNRKYNSITETKNTAWSTDEERFKSLLEIKRFSVRELSKRFGRGENAIRAKAKRLGLLHRIKVERRQFADVSDWKERVEFFALDGAPPKYVAMALGVIEHVLKSWLKKNYGVYSLGALENKLRDEYDSKTIEKIISSGVKFCA